jgi:tetratricopeptide (TPR) repeat protein
MAEPIPTGAPPETKRAALRTELTAARAHLQAARPDAAAALLAPLCRTHPDEPRVWALLAEARRLAGDRLRAASAMARAAQLDPTEGNLRNAAARLVEAGRLEAAARFERQVREARAARLTGRLADALGDLETAASAEGEPGAAELWAWSFADQARWSFEAWRSRAAWGRRAGKLIYEWWFGGPERAEEIGALMVADAMDEVRAAMAGGRGCVLAGAHIGPIFAAAHLFDTCGQPHRSVVAPGKGRVGTETGTTLAAGPGAREQAIALIQAGGLLSMLCDVPVARADKVELLGRRISLVDGPIWMTRDLGAASFWFAPRWRDGRIVVDFERLPDPAPGEGEAAWTTRWRAAYLARLEQALRGAPENLTLSAGLWTEAGQAAT